MNINRHRDDPTMDLTRRQQVCQHRYIAVARNVTAAIRSAAKGRLFFFDGDSENGIFKQYAEIEYCTNKTCDRVFYAEEMK